MAITDGRSFTRTERAYRHGKLKAQLRKVRPAKSSMYSDPAERQACERGFRDECARLRADRPLAVPGGANA